MPGGLDGLSFRNEISPLPGGKSGPDSPSGGPPRNIAGRGGRPLEGVIMGLPGLRTHRKFRRLVAILRIPEAHALGHLQMMWETSWDHLSPALGDTTDVELSAGWVGDPGALAAALVACGGDGPGFLEPDEGGRFLVHDWEEHAPSWVRKKMKLRSDLAADGLTVEDLKRKAGIAGAAKRWEGHITKNGKRNDMCHENDGICHSENGKRIAKNCRPCPSPPLPSPPIEEPNGSSSPLPPKTESLDWFMETWNSTLAPLGYGKCLKATPKRKESLKARMKADPGFRETFARAVDYLAKDSWWRARAAQFTIDLLLEQVNRAQELSEKTPTLNPSNGATNGKQHIRTATDQRYIAQLAERDARRAAQPSPAPLIPGGDDDLQGLF